MNIPSLGYLFKDSSNVNPSRLEWKGTPLMQTIGVILGTVYITNYQFKNIIVDYDN